MINLTRKYRLILICLSLVALFLIGWIIDNSFSFLTDFWFASGLLLLILLSLVDQPFFSKDTNIFVNSITAVLSLLLIPSNGHNAVFWTFLIISGYLIISSYALMWLRNKTLGDEPKSVQFLSRMNRIIGNPKAIFSAFFLWGAAGKFFNTPWKFNILLLYWMIFLILNIPSLATDIENLFTKISEVAKPIPIGTIFGVQSKNTFLVKLTEDKKEPLDLFDFVEFQYSMDNIHRCGLILDVYLLNQAQWVKVLTTTEIDNLFKDQSVNCKPDVVYKILPPKDCDYLSRFLGVVIENTTIEKVRFLYSSKVAIVAGQLIEVEVGAHKVLYQTVEGITKLEQLESKNQSSSIIGEAIQLGEWRNDTGKFERYGWVPSINTPMFLASEIKELEPKPTEYLIGYIPGTHYPVFIDKNIAVTHHTAILGVTGSGKSVFARNLLQQIASETTKIIVVDLTGEYKERVSKIVQIISNDDAEKSFKAIEDIATEKAKYPSQQNPTLISDNETIIKKAFHNSIEEFLKGANNKAVFELSDISNSANIFEYTKWFFKVLFQVAKTENSFGKRVCIVIEEAHTVIPETNTAGASDYASKAAVNSIAQIALQGRKYNIGFIVIAQRTANVSKTVLTQCNSIIAFQEFDKTSSDFLSNYMGEEFVKVLSNLKFRNAIAVGKAFRSTTPMLFEVPEIQETANEPFNHKEDSPDKGTVPANGRDF